jgi:pimeloyl-ACP methyl ester carboxylesterase
MKSEVRRIGDVAVHVGGAGSSIVLLHANGGSHQDFDAVIDTLSTNAKVFAVDWPGHGESDGSQAPGACAFADLLPSLLENLNEGPYTLIGNSVGGFAAIKTAAERPDLVNQIVVVNPGGFTPRWPITFITTTI